MPLNCWQVGGAHSVAVRGGTVALSHAELVAARASGSYATDFVAAVRKDVPRADAVKIWLPPYRGMAVVSLLAWLAAARLATPAADVTWTMRKNQGPASVQRILESAHWELSRRKEGAAIELRGRAPVDVAPPRPSRFVTALGPTSAVTLEADYGVFSPDRVDDGTALLLDVALEHTPVPTVADIGVGYGALAIGLVLAGTAGAAVGTDVDAVALWLAERNARAHGVALELALTEDPLAVPATRLTVCNVPTHIPAADSARLLGALAERARHGDLLIVVHRSLVQRYLAPLSRVGRPIRREGENHVVLGIMH